VRQDRKPEAGKQKHNHGEHRVWIFDRDTCSLVCFVFRCGPKRYLTPQLLHFRSFLDRILHLPVPSEDLSRRGKRFSECLPPTTPGNRGEVTRRGALQENVKRWDLTKDLAERRQTSGKLGTQECVRCTSLFLAIIDHRRPKGQKAGRTCRDLPGGVLHLF